MTAKAKQAKGVDELVIQAVGHPIRIDALAIFNERTASPNEIAKELGEGVSLVGYHVIELLKTGCIEPVKTEPRRGAVEHYYRATTRPHISDEEWRELSEESRQEISTLVFQAIVGEGLGSLRAGKLDAREDRHLSWRVLSLDEAGWQELMAMLANSLGEVEEIEAKSIARLAEAGEAGFSAIVAMMGFERAGRRRPPDNT